MKLLSVLYILLFSISTTLLAQIPSYIPTDGLVAWYPFNGNANDESGNGNDGAVNGASLTTDKDGNENGAYSFDGVNDYIDVGNGEYLNPTDRIAIQAWIYPKGFENNKHVISKGSHTNFYHRAYSIHSPYEDSLWVSFITVDNTEVTVKSNSIAELNKWTHILLQFDGQSIEFYINGILEQRIIANTEGSGKINLVQNEPLYFGSHKPSNVDYYFDGKINDIAIWNRPLTEEEIRNIYYEGNPPVPPSYIPTDGLVAWYPFNGNANDESGNGNNGTVNGATLTTDKDGNENSAYGFDGVDDLISVNSNSLTTDAITIKLKRKINNTSNPIFETFFLIGSEEGANNTYASFIDIGIDNINSKVTRASLNYDYGFTGQDIPEKEWMEIVVVFDGVNQELKFYLNSVLLSSKKVNVNQFILNTENAKTIIGAGYSFSQDKYANFFNGTIDDVAIWNRALTEEEIRNIYYEGNPPVPPSYIPTDGLVAWYPFNGNANDESGNGNNGTVNGAILTTDKDGNENSAYSFDGVDDEIRITNSDDFNDLPELTISTWVNFSSLPNWQNNEGRSIITKLIPAEANIDLSFALYTEHDEDALRFDFKTNESSSNNRLTPFSNYLDENTWYNLIITYDGEYGRTFWDGELVSISSATSSQIRNTASQLNIGGAFSSKAKSFNGQIDDIAIWNRALTEEEIQAVYNEKLSSSKLSIRSLQVDSSYTKRGFKFSNYVSLDTLAASDSLISYQFDLDIPDGIIYDSLRVFHSESTPSVTTNYEDGTLTVVTTGSGFITTYNPMLELFYTSDTTGTYSLTPTNVVLNTTNITNISSGVMKIDPFIKGDVDDSGVIQAYDASIILHQSVGSEILKPDPVKDWEMGPWFNWRDAAADVDEDGDILALDASYISQYVAGLITEFPTATPQVESVIIEVTDRGLKVTAPESIQSLNIELPATDQVEFRDPEMSWNNSSVAMNKAEGMRVAVSSSEQVSGEVMEIPLYVYTNDNITLEVTTITNNTKKVHQVMVSGLTVNSEVITGLPEKYTLSQNYPNPFNPSTQIQYALPEATQVTLEVFNSLGQKVMELVNGQKSAGYHTATFDASGLSSGVYLYKLTTPSFTQTKKMLLIK